MNVYSLLDLVQLRFRVAQQRLLRHWQIPHACSGQICPRCGSVDVLDKGRLWSAPVSSYQCRICGRDSTERPVTFCSCAVPGSQEKCADCSHYQGFFQRLALEQGQLLSLDVAALRQLLDEESV